MKKSLVLMTILSFAVFGLSLGAYAGDSQQFSALQQKAERLQNQINLAQQQCGANLSRQLKPLSDSIENLVKQRVQLGAQIQRMESQVQDLKQSANSTCQRQVKQYQAELVAVKQQIANETAKKNAAATHKPAAANHQPGAANHQPAVAAAQPAPPGLAPSAATPAPPGFRTIHH